MTVHPGIAYAEETLRVHKVYEEAQEAHDSLTLAHKSLGEARSLKVQYEEELADREAALSASERIANPDMSQAAFDRHLKTIIQLDTSRREIRNKIHEAAYKIGEAEGIVRSLELNIRIRVARLEELGGYLGYLAALKDADTRERSGLPWRPPGSPW